MRHCKKKLIFTYTATKTSLHYISFGPRWPDQKLGSKTRILINRENQEDINRTRTYLTLSPRVFRKMSPIQLFILPSDSRTDVVTKIGFQILFWATHLAPRLYHTRLHCFTNHVYTWTNTRHKRTQGWYLEPLEVTASQSLTLRVHPLTSMPTNNTNACRKQRHSAFVYIR